MRNEEMGSMMAESAPAVTSEAPVDNTVMLVDWCALESANTRRISLLSAFHHSENKAGRLRDTAANFKQRFDAFATKPV